jgi:CRP-like cAMP-binding protein
MRYQLDDSEIPENELDAFDEFIHIFQKGDVLMTEGQTDDNSLYLLRKGRVGIYRNINEKEELISEIYATNFFGEQELIHSGPRYATIRALSHEIIVYKFRRMNLHYVYSNPRLAEKLIVRLSGDIKQYSDMLVQKNEEIKKLTDKMDDTIYQNAFVVLALEEMQEIHLNKFQEKTDTWKLFDGILHLTRRILKVRLPAVYERITTLHGYEVLSRLERDGVITSSMFNFLTKPVRDLTEEDLAFKDDEPPES